jgi:hypothetical protein
MALTRKYLDSSKGILNMRTRITITGLFLLAVATALLNIQQQSSLAFAAGEYKNLLYVGKQDRTTDIFELLSGIFAAILFVLSLRAYTKLKIKGMLYVSAAFGIFSSFKSGFYRNDMTHQASCVFSRLDLFYYRISQASLHLRSNACLIFP